MAFNSSPSRAEYTATAGQTVFPFVFKIFTDGDINVYLTPSGQTPDDTVDILLLTTDYTVSINGDAGGEVTLVVAASAGDSITIERSLDVDRSIEYQNNGDLLADTLNADQNYQTYLIADQDANGERHMKLPSSVQGVSTELPAPEGDEYLKWNADGTALENDATIPGNVQDAIDAADAAAISETNAATSESNAATSATNAQLKAWEAEAEQLTADSYATEAEDVFVNVFTSDGDGTFTATPTTEYSSFHWSKKSELGSGGTLGGLTDVVITAVADGETLAYDSGTGNWVNVAGGPAASATPILSPTTKSQGETVQYILTVTNWGSYTTPVLTIVTEGGTGFTDNLDGTITITPPAYTGVDDIHDIDVQCTDGALAISATATHVLTVLDIAADTAIVWEGATLNDTTIPTTPNATITANVLTADANNAVSESIKITSGFTNINAIPTVINGAVNYTISAGATTTSVTITGATTFVIGDTLLMNKTATTALSEIDTTSITTDNGGNSYTFDLTGLSFTNPPQIVAKDTASISTSLVASAGVDSFVARTAQSHTADVDGASKGGDGASNPSTTKYTPDMTSATTPSGTVFASAFNATYPAWKAFDGLKASFVDACIFTALPATVGYIGTSTVVNKYTITSREIGNSLEAPQDWTIQGSTDTTDGTDGTWDTLDTVTGETTWGDYETRTFTFVNSISYISYRLVITNSQDGRNPTVVELELIEAQANPATTITDIFDADTRQGEDYKAQITQHDAGDNISSIVTAIDKIV